MIKTILNILYQLCRKNKINTCFACYEEIDRITHRIKYHYDGLDIIITFNGEKIIVNIYNSNNIKWATTTILITNSDERFKVLNAFLVVKECCENNVINFLKSSVNETN